MTHWRLGRSVWNSRRIVGIATFRIVLSSTGMATDAITTTAAHHRRGSGPSGSGAADAEAPGMGGHACTGRNSEIPALASGRSQVAHMVAGQSGNPQYPGSPWRMIDDR